MDNNTKCVGIDLGTTYCCVYVFDTQTNEAHVFKYANGNTTVASKVQFRDHPVTVGQSFDDSITETKRLIGLKFSNEKTQEEIEKLSYRCEQADGDQIAIEIEHNGEDQLISPEEVAAIILRFIKNELSKTYDNIKASITVPAYFEDEQRKATELAGKAAGLEVVRIINEPTAAALAYGLDKNDKSRILVFDFGGGTLDITIAILDNKKLDIEYSGGDFHLGGIDVDRCTADLILEQWALYDEGIVSDFVMKKKMTGRKRSEVKKKRHALEMVAEKTKIQLSYRESVNVELDEFYVNGSDDQPDIFITRDDFEEANEKVFDRCDRLLRKALKESGFKPNDIDEVILVGGSSQIPKIREILSKKFGVAKINSNINCDEVVAKGACLWTRELLFNEGRFTLPKEVTAHSISITNVDDNGKSFDSVVVERNTKIPFSNINDPKYAVKVNKYQTDADVFIKEDEKQLGRFHIKNLSTQDELISIFLEISNDGKLTVSGQCGNSKAQTAVNVESKTNKTEEDITGLQRRVENFFN